MKTFSYILAISFGLVAIAGAQANPDDHTSGKQTDPKAIPQMKFKVVERLQGRWMIAQGTNQGKRLSAEELKDTYVAVQTNVITTYDADENERYRAVFTIDETKKPIQITMDGFAARPAADPRIKVNEVEHPRNA